MNQSEIASMVRMKVQEFGSQQKWADAVGISRPYVAAVLNGHAKPGKKLLEALGLERVWIYRKIDR
jgi:transcriptional regulator with XRE-family HTH domain